MLPTPETHNPTDETRFRELSSEAIIETIEVLSQRIFERFPNSGLCGASKRLLSIGNQTKQQIHTILRPIFLLRAGIVLLVSVIIVGIVGTIYTFEIPQSGFNLFNFIQVLEAGINDIVLIGALIFFLATFELRIKRRRTLSAIHQLRSMAHIVDMLQLKKDPERVFSPEQRTASSPAERFTAHELNRYLDYCSELLSLTGKLAALYAQHFNDAVVLAAVTEVEALTTNLEQKVWQKLMILHAASQSSG